MQGSAVSASEREGRDRLTQALNPQSIGKAEEGRETTGRDNACERNFSPVPADPVLLRVRSGVLFESPRRSTTISLYDREDEENYWTVTIRHTSGFLLEVNYSLK
jgi:hypothetical protein